MARSRLPGAGGAAGRQRTTGSRLPIPWPRTRNLGMAAQTLVAVRAKYVLHQVDDSEA
jgi:hypothetical protein